MNKKFFKYVTSISVAAVIVLAAAVWVCIETPKEDDAVFL